MLVAPVNITYNYEPYTYPMFAELDSEGLTVRVPPDFIAGFNMTNPQNQSSELYTLRFMQLRKPGKVPEGSKQVMSHVFEVALVHQETTGTGYWASVVVPFEVGTDVMAGMLTHLVDEAQLPTAKGEVQPVLVSDARPLELNEVWDQASFSHSWTTLPTGCQGIVANTRQFMRNRTMVVNLNTFNRLMDILRAVPDGSPLPSPTLVWEVVGCPEKPSEEVPCVPLVAQNLQSQLTEAQALQSSTLTNMRNRKSTMDQILVQLENNSLPSLTSAIAARDSLRDAQSQFESATRTVDQLQFFISQAGNATWDADAPAPSRNALTSLVGVPVREPTPRFRASPIQAQRSSSREGPVVNLLYGSGRTLLRSRALLRPHGL